MKIFSISYIMLFVNIFNIVINIVNYVKTQEYVEGGPQDLNLSEENDSFRMAYITAFSS